MRFYFERPECSNSNLKSLRRMFRAEEFVITEKLQESFNFGKLIDALRTSVNLLVGNKLYDDNLIDFIIVSDEDLERARKLDKFLREDPLLKMFSETMVGQFVFIRLLKFTYEGTEYSIRARCKFDHFVRKFGIGVDYKTTAAKTQKEFEASIEFLDYDQAAAWYMDLARINYFWIIGICKSKNLIFKYAIRRGDLVHARGVSKYSKWAYHWATLIEPF